MSKRLSLVNLNNRVTYLLSSTLGPFHATNQRVPVGGCQLALKDCENYVGEELRLMESLL